MSSAEQQVRTVEVPGAVLAVHRPAEEAGADGREPGLFVHGLGGSAANWTALMDRLAGVVDGEAVDLPGFGHSDPPTDGNLSLSGHVRAVIGYLEASGRGPVHLFGNSLGGAVAVRLAALRPDLVRTLTLVSPALPELPPQRSAWSTGLLALPGLPALLRRLPAGRPVARAAGVRAARQAGRLPLRPPGLRGLRRRPAAGAAGVRARGDDGAPRRGRPGRARADRGPRPLRRTGRPAPYSAR
ncbi:alpha/beta fold hydrolase [Kitasatospora sp. NPDC053057]|uniref:alpha/beta fold hydrolase n=1 Tax=Kitasatospora sp. NPDC053057 TaxID=3364062 RepID=UPI0037C9B54E